MKTAFQKIAEQQILVNGIWQPACLLALSSKFPNAKYNIAPDGVTPDLRTNAVNNGFVFDGTDYIDCGYPSQAIDDEITIIARYTFDNATVPAGNTYGETLMVKNSNYGVNRRPTTNRFAFYNGATNYEGVNSTWVAGREYVILATCGGGTYSIYIDLELDKTGSATLRSPTTQPIYLGAYPSLLSQTAFDGKIEDMIILQKFSTSDEVKALFKLYGDI